MALRYTVRQQSDGDYCVWDNETDEPAETATGFQYINLTRAKAHDEADNLNNPD